ncbi:hypothetical protein BDZ94DRAFT_1270217 [Collybia nuda]|uniref:Uncharacterized protein n=1 Tax=Collybia nuda TaxID=64659 RepID=A0A9P5XZN8_9AGAR|nr:hypothetical protein BDZ94DRAFT_1270217 [Collybia nuda]
MCGVSSFSPRRTELRRVSRSIPISSSDSNLYFYISSVLCAGQRKRTRVIRTF